MEANEIIANACANRAFIYQYLWRVFSDVPDETLIETTLRTAREQFELFFGADSPEMKEFAALCVELHTALALDAKASSLANEYTRLFIGNSLHRPGNRYMHAAKSWYFSKARSTFAPHTTPPDSPRRAIRTSPMTILQPSSRSWRRCAAKQRHAPLRAICLAQRSHSAVRRCF